MNIQELRDRQAECLAQADAIEAKAEAEKRDLLPDERRESQSLLNECDALEEEVTIKERKEAKKTFLTQPIGRQSEPEPTNRMPADPEGERTPPTNGKTNGAEKTFAKPKDRREGFRNLGEFAHSVYRSSLRGAQIDPRLQNIVNATLSTFGQESVGADGGFAVPPDFQTEIMVKITGQDSLLSRTDQIRVQGNRFTAPVDMTTPWGTTGITTSWLGEAATKPQTKPVLEERSVALHKLAALVPVTDELLEDAPAMDTYLRRKAPEKINFAVSLAIVSGNGVGKPIGFMASPALVSVAKETGQVADTIIGNNILKMYSRMHPESLNNAIWLVNPDVQAMLMKLSIAGTDNTGNAVTGWGGLLYMPPGGLSVAPYGTLLGRPVVPHQAMETLGDQGDIAFVDLSQYLTILKSGPNPKTDVSIHLWFDQDVTAFRFVLRVGGQPWWSAAYSARDGSATYSPFVTLDERA